MPISTYHKKCHFLTLNLNGLKIQVLVSSGAAHSCIVNNYSKILADQFQPISTNIIIGGGSAVPGEGILGVILTIGSAKRVILVYIVGGSKYEAVLGLDVLSAFGIRIDLKNNTWC